VMSLARQRRWAWLAVRLVRAMMCLFLA
jgi:hypothetical protein